MNIRDIAKLAGVTRTTVSKILNNTGSISEETKRKHST
jgi:DNA-binding LacI/PurR family transcriptional regulator